MTDQELLAQFSGGDNAAFEEVVSRHLSWVHSAALRQVRDAQMAEDVTQIVFLILLKKARQAEKARHVGAWLFRVLRYTALDARRRAQRREHHERLAAEMVREEQTQEPGNWDEMAPMLDELMAKLREKDRAAILLRFYEGKTFGEIATVLGISEEAARKRVERAVEKLNERFARKGIVAETVGLGTVMAQRTNLAAPISSRQVVTGMAKHKAQAQEIVEMMNRAKLMKMLASSGGVAAILVLLFWLLPGQQRSAQAQTSQVGTGKPQAEKVDAPAGLAIQQGWPLALPGNITCTPVVAELDGKMVVIVPCQKSHYGNVQCVHSKPDDSVWLYAFYADGTNVPGWPVELVRGVARLQKERQGGYTECWTSSPSVCKDDTDHTKIVLTTPYFFGTRVVSADGKMQNYRGGSQWANMPVVDIDGDGVPDVIGGASLTNVNHGAVKGWIVGQHPMSRVGGFSPCIGDANGDGKLEVFNLFVREDDWNDLGMNRAEIVGFAQDGTELANWRHKVQLKQHIAFAPVMGDVSGDGKMEIIGNYGGIYVFTSDGKPAPGTNANGILKDAIGWGACSPTLADLDGDGKAEIIVYNHVDHTVRAWHGDGKPMGNSDGVIATLPSSRFVTTAKIGNYGQIPFGGISVADLGGDGVMDLFVGIYWIKFDPKTGKSSVTAMAPEDSQMNGSQPTIADVDGDGKAEIIFGLTDGRVFVYRTEMTYDEKLVQWATANGNFQHTGVWTPNH